MGFLFQFFAWIGTQIYASITRRSTDLKPASELGIPSIDEGRVIPWIAGTVKITSPMVASYGDLYTTPVKVTTGFLGFGPTDTIGYNYYLKYHLVLCSGAIDGVVDLQFDDKSIIAGVTPTIDSDSTYYSIYKPTFYGGPVAGEGGLNAGIIIYHGTPTQPADPSLPAIYGHAVSAWPNICHLRFQGLIGTSPYMRRVSLILNRWPNQLGLTSGYEEIDGDANPAAMIYDILTSPLHQNGMGIPSGFIDVAGLLAMGETLATEGFGLSMKNDTGVPALEMIMEICRHIDAVPYLEPLTGLLTFKLARLDYNPLTVPVLDPSNCTVTRYDRSAWEEMRNVIRIKFTDGENFYERIAQAQDVAGISIQGGEVNAEDIAFHGITKAATAQKVAARELMTLGYQLASVDIRADRTAWDFRPGTVFRLDWPPYGISGLICRVSPRVGSGLVTDGKIEFSAVEDIFSVAWTAYGDPPDSGWEDPLLTTPVITDQAVLNSPYEPIKGLGDPGPFAICLAAQGAGMQWYKLWIKNADASWTEDASAPPALTPSGTLNGDVAIDDTTIVLDDPDGIGLSDLQTASDADCAAGRNLLWIDDEFIAFKTVVHGSGVVTLSDCVRGCLDTVPATHSTGERVWAISYGSHVVNVRDSVTNYLRFQAYNSKTNVDFASAAEETVVVNSPNRRTLPNVPTDIRIRGQIYPTFITWLDDIVLSWEHRDRLSSWSYLDAGITAAEEPGTTYTVRVYGDGDVLKHTETGIVGLGWTYDYATEETENGGTVNTDLRIQVWAERGGNASWQVWEWSFQRLIV